MAFPRQGMTDAYCEFQISLLVNGGRLGAQMWPHGPHTSIMCIARCLAIFSVAREHCPLDCAVHAIHTRHTHLKNLNSQQYLELHKFWPPLKYTYTL